MSFLRIASLVLSLFLLTPGPTDAAGAWLDCDVLHTMRERQLEPAEFLAINNSYAFFELAGGLLKTGPTHTNVMDVRVALVGGQAKGAAEAD